MEDILDLYALPGKKGVSRLCFDERPCQLLGEKMTALPLKKGQTIKEDYEYVRKGTCVVLLAYDIDRGIRYLQVREQRTKKDYAEFMHWLVSTHYKDKEKILLVQDNLNTHKYGAFYERYEASVAHWLKNKLEFHFTPRHASWLNMAEIEFSALVRQSIGKRIDSIDNLRTSALAWQEKRNKLQTRICWSFTTEKARIKLKKHYDLFLRN